MPFAVGLALALVQKPVPYSFRPMETSEEAKHAHEQIVGSQPLLKLVVAFGSDPKVAVTTRFNSKTLQDRLAKAAWQRKDPPFQFMDSVEGRKAQFDLADAYAACYVTHAELYQPMLGQYGDELRQWPVAKIRRQFQRAITQSDAKLTQAQKEELYFALARSASMAQEWWIGIRTAITARGDAIGTSREDASWVMEWLMGVSADKIETDSISSGVQPRAKPRQ